jgi:hypothetical protein
MERNLANVVAELGRLKKTGMLAASVKNGASLFKLFLRAGIIYHMRYESLWDSACLSKLAELDLNAGFFLPGARVDTASADLPSPEELFAWIQRADKKLDWGADPEAAQVYIETGVLVKLEEDLFRIAGPMASIVLQNAYRSCGLKKGAPLSLEEFEYLVQTIKEQLPDELKQAFVKSYGG